MSKIFEVIDDIASVILIVVAGYGVLTAQSGWRNAVPYVALLLAAGAKFRYERKADK